MTSNTSAEEAGKKMVGCLSGLRRYAYALLGERAAADDLVQETFGRAWERIETWTGKGDIRPWLFSIMHNLHIDQLRKPRLSIVSVEEEEASEAFEVPVRSTQTDSLELRDLEVALYRLPESYRQVLLLIALEDMSYAQAAEVLGWPIGTVMGRLSRARDRLRRELDDQAGNVLKVVK